MRIWEDKGEWRVRISVNGKVIKEDRRVNATTIGRQDVICRIPSDLIAGKNIVTVKVQSCPWFKGPCISEIRTLKTL
jgi:hypothetical protein